MADTQWNIEHLLATAVAYMRDVGMPNEADAIIELQLRAATPPADAALADASSIRLPAGCVCTTKANDVAELIDSAIQDAELEQIIEESDARWTEDMFHVHGGELMDMLRKAAALRARQDVEALANDKYTIETAHEYVRNALGLPDDAPRRFDFYAQEIAALRARPQAIPEGWRVLDDGHRVTVCWDGAGYTLDARKGSIHEAFCGFVRDVVKSAAASPQPAAVPEAVAKGLQWTKGLPDEPGAYYVRGWMHGDKSMQALVEVALDETLDGESEGYVLVCNIHKKNSDCDVTNWDLLDDVSDSFEWLGPLKAAILSAADTEVKNGTRN